MARIFLPAADVRQSERPRCCAPCSWRVRCRRPRARACRSSSVYGQVSAMPFSRRPRRHPCPPADRCSSPSRYRRARPARGRPRARAACGTSPSNVSPWKSGRSFSRWMPESCSMSTRAAAAGGWPSWPPGVSRAISPSSSGRASTASAGGCRAPSGAPRWRASQPREIELELVPVVGRVRALHVTDLALVAGVDDAVDFGAA